MLTYEEGAHSVIIKCGDAGTGTGILLYVSAVPRMEKSFPYSLSPAETGETGQLICHEVKKNQQINNPQTKSRGSKSIYW